MTAKTRTITLNEWETNYLISEISSTLDANKSMLETVRKEFECCADEFSQQLRDWKRIKLNNEIFKFNLVEGLLAKLTNREPNFEELVKESEE